MRRDVDDGETLTEFYFGGKKRVIWGEGEGVGCGLCGKCARYRLIGPDDLPVASLCLLPRERLNWSECSCLVTVPKVMMHRGWFRSTVLELELVRFQALYIIPGLFIAS